MATVIFMSTVLKYWPMRCLDASNYDTFFLEMKMMSFFFVEDAYVVTC